MIYVGKDDILKTDAEALVNTVNCVGIMGRGIALQFKKAFPGNFKAYAEACKRGEVQIGKMFVYDTEQLTNPRYIINFPTKQHWKGKSKLEFIETGLHALVQEIKKRNIQSIAIPPLGCGLGGLNWNQIKPKIEKSLAAVPDVSVYLFDPGKAPEDEKMIKQADVPELGPNRAALISLIGRYLSGLMDPFITVLEVQKLMYFMQAAGQKSLKLRYERGPYGPYAPNLSHLLNLLEGHYISGYGDSGDQPYKELKLIDNSMDIAIEVLSRDKDAHERFEKVSSLVSGFETPAGMELLATVHWVSAHEHIDSKKQTVAAIHDWSERKKKLFNERQIEIAYDVLNAKGWLASSASI